MFNLLQTLQDTKTKRLVVYLGIKGNYMIARDENGEIIKDRTGKRFKEITNEEGKILIGKEVEKWGIYGYYFGYIRQDLWSKMNPDMDLKKYVKEG